MHFPGQFGKKKKLKGTTQNVIKHGSCLVGQKTYLQQTQNKFLPCISR